MFTKLKFVAICCAVFAILYSCKKDDPEPVETTNTTPASSGSFSWTVNGNTSFTSDSTRAYASYTSIYAYKGGASNSMEINLGSLAAGTYTISSATGNALTLIKNGTSYSAGSGTVTLSSSGSKLSGTLTAAFSGTVVTTVTGQFSDVPVR